MSPGRPEVREITRTDLALPLTTEEQKLRQKLTEWAEKRRQAQNDDTARMMIEKFREECAGMEKALARLEKALELDSKHRSQQGATTLSKSEGKVSS